MPNNGFLLGFIAGISLGFLLWTDTGKMLTGATKEHLKAELKRRLEELERR